MAILITMALFAALLSAISYVGYRFYARPGRVYEQLGGQAAFNMPAVDAIRGPAPGLLVTVIEQLGEKIRSRGCDGHPARPDRGGLPLR
jgi:hypothetical protein